MTLSSIETEKGFCSTDVGYIELFFLVIVTSPAGFVMGFSRGVAVNSHS